MASSNPPSRSIKRIIVGMSGGVDSSVAALRLKQQGYEVAGLFMKNWEEDDTTEHCTAAKDVADAQAVCDKIGITLHRVNFAAEYWEDVFKHFLAEYQAGRTPNPDLLCNKEIKFKAFLDHARDLGADAIATGHYAKIGYSEGYYQLLKGDDPQKDQSYFLYMLNQSQLAASVFPLGDLHKNQVRQIAQEAGLPTFDKKDSTGICFIGERHFKSFLQKYLKSEPGNIETPEGKVLGQHDGLMFYTLGQRRGLQVGGQTGAEQAPWYIAVKDASRNVLVVVQDFTHPLLMSNTLTGITPHWISRAPDTLPYECTAKTRYHQNEHACTIMEVTPDRVTVRFKEPQRAVTPGQSVVFYKDNNCLGGAVIEQFSTVE